EKLLQQAFGQAREQNFTAAISYLQEISPDTQIGAKIQAKLTEYRQKQKIRASFLLQQAYDQAEMGEFLAAIHFLEQIPLDTKIGQIAKQKIAEYTEKEQIKRKVEQEQQLTRTQQPQSAKIHPGNQLQEINLKPNSSAPVIF
ncbi:MAG: hypothetical protein F6K24_55675, partial [Okeania sp. SIO2D1]|nr:hypothetical protein [Okeania sp. SIO2D1]